MRIAVIALVSIALGCSERDWSSVDGIQIVDRHTVLLVGSRGTKSMHLARMDLTGKRLWSHELGAVSVANWYMLDDHVVLRIDNAHAKEEVLELRELSRGAIVWRRVVPFSEPDLSRRLYVTPEVLVDARGPTRGVVRLTGIDRGTGATVWERNTPNPIAVTLREVTTHARHLQYHVLDRAPHWWFLDVRNGTETPLSEASGTCRIDDTQLFVARDGEDWHLVGYPQGDPRQRTQVPYRVVPQHEWFELEACATYGHHLAFVVTDASGVTSVVIMSRSGETVRKSRLYEGPTNFDAFRDALPRYVPFIVHPRSPTQFDIATLDMETGEVRMDGREGPTYVSSGFYRTGDRWVHHTGLDREVTRLDGNSGEVAIIEADRAVNGMVVRDDRIAFYGSFDELAVLDAQTLEPLGLRGFKLKKRSP